jgi:hypothetical protein
VHIQIVVARLHREANTAVPNVKRWRKLPISLAVADIRDARGKQAKRLLGSRTFDQNEANVGVFGSLLKR